MGGLTTLQSFALRLRRRLAWPGRRLQQTVGVARETAAAGLSRGRAPAGKAQPRCVRLQPASRHARRRRVRDPEDAQFEPSLDVAVREAQVQARERDHIDVAVAGPPATRTSPPLRTTRGSGGFTPRTLTGR